MFNVGRKNSLPRQTPEIVAAGIPRRGKRAPIVRLTPACSAGEGNTLVVAPGVCKELNLSDAGYPFPYRDRLVLLHELGHTKWTRPYTKAEMAEIGPRALNAVEDGFIHKKLWQQGLSEQFNRDLVADLFNDYRGMKRAKALGTAEGNDWVVYAMPRVLAGIKYADYHFSLTAHGSRRTAFLIRRLRGRVLAMFPGGTHETIEKIMELILNPGYIRKNPVRTRAGKLLNTLFTPEPPKPEAAAATRPDEVVSDNGVTVHFKTLPLVARCDSTAPTVFTASSGAVIRTDTLVRSKTVGRVGFLRLTPFVPGGVVLIDASGSMRPTAELLNQLCSIMPAARILFYNGNGNVGRRIEGQIVTYAVGGRRADRIPPEVLYWGGNTIDLNAVNYALSFPGPHILVSDMGFCEGKAGDAEMAEIIARNRFARIFGSLMEAIETYTGRKSL